MQYVQICRWKASRLNEFLCQILSGVWRQCLVVFQRLWSTFRSTRRRTCSTWSKTRCHAPKTSTCWSNAPAGSIRFTSTPAIRLTSTWCTSRFDRTSSTEACSSSPTKLSRSLWRSVSSAVENSLPNNCAIVVIYLAFDVNWRRISVNL